MYLPTIIDCFDGMLVSWTNGTSLGADLVNTMLDAAIETVTDTSDRPVVHSDRGGAPLAMLAVENKRREPHPLDVSRGLFP